MKNPSFSSQLRRVTVALTLLLCTMASHQAFASFDYGTGLIASNAAPFATAGGTNITVSGNDITVTGNVTIVTNGTNAGVYNFHNLTINSGATVTVSGGVNPLIIKCSGTFTNNGIITAAGGAGLATTGGGSTTNDWGSPNPTCSTTASLPGGLGGAGGGGWGTAGGVGGVGGGTALSGYVSGSTPKGGNSTNFASAGASGVAGAGLGGKPYTPVIAGSGGSYGTVGGSSSGTTSATVFTLPGTAYGGGTTLGGPQVDGIKNLWGGCGGGGGGGRFTSCVALTSAGGSGGGGGGGAIRITANTIAMQTTGSSGLISVRGGDGGGNRAGTTIGKGAGGAGSGGTIHLQYAGSGSLTFAGSATIPGAAATDVTAGVNYAGGTGGNCATGFTIGGNGGAGRYLAEQDIASCSAPVPTATANGTATSITACNSTPVALAATASNCSGTMTYSWSTGAGQYWNGTNFTGSSASFSSAYNNITVTPASNATTTYTVTGTCSAVTCTGSSAVSVTTSALSTYDYGTGAEGSVVISSNQTLSGTHNYINFTINPGVTVTASGNAPLIIKCMGDATINGTVTAAGGNGGLGGNFVMPSTPAPAGTGGTGGGGGWGAAGGNGGQGVVCCTAGTGSNGSSFGTSSGRGVGGNYYNGAGTITAGTAGSYGTVGSTAPSGANTPGNSSVGTTYGDPAISTSMTSNSITTTLLGGSGGGGGGARNQTVASTAIAGGDGGGGGGGAIKITAYNINIASTGLVTVRGGNGPTTNTNGTGAGAGGSGGTLVMQYGTSFKYNGSTTINGATGTDVTTGINFVGGTGGNAGTSYTVGGAGGQGRYLTQLDPNPCAACTAPILTAQANGTATSITVCSSPVALSTNPSSGGFGCTGTFQYAWGDGTHYWNGTNMTTATSPVYNSTYATITVTPAANTTTTYVATGQCSASPSCTSTSSVTVTAKAQPTDAFTGGNTTVCTNASVTLTQNVTNGVGTPTYQWQTSTTSGGTYSGAGGTNNGATYTPSTSATGTNWYTLSLTYPTATGCTATPPAGQSVQVNTQPTVAFTGGNTTVCTNASVTLTQNVINGVGTPTYQWETSTTSGGTYSAAGGTNNGATYAPATSATGTEWYSLSVTYPTATGCTATVPTGQSVTVVDQPISGTLTPAGNQGAVCSGADVSVTATSGINGTGAIADVLQYRFDGGTWLTYTSGTQLNTAGHTSVDIQTYRTASGSNCGSSTPNITSWNVSAGANTWVGGASGNTTDWFTAGNWTCNFVPNASTNVLIPSGRTFYPSVAGAAPGSPNALANDVTVQNGASINVVGTNGANLEIHGNFANSGALTMTTQGKVLLKGGAAQTISGNNDFTNLIINNTHNVSITSGPSNTQKVSGELTLTAGQLTTNNNLTITSDINGAGLINDFSPNTLTGTISGNVTIERYVVNPSGGFYYISSPVGGANVTDWNVEFANSPLNGATDGSQVIPTSSCSLTNLATNSPYGSLFDYSESTVTNCNLQGWHTRFSGAITVGKGFAGHIPNGTHLSLSGTYTTGNFSSPQMTSTGANTTTSKGFNLVANPYASPISWLDVATANNGSGPQGTAYVYHSTGAYAGTYVSINAISVSPGADLIGSSESFYVKTTSSATLSFTNSMRRTGTNTFLRTAPAYEQLVTLDVTGNNFKDKALVAFGVNFTDSFDAMYDANKMMSRAGQPSIYATDVADKYSIYAVPSPTQVKHVPVSLEAGTSGNFNINAALTNFPSTALVYLEDLQMHTMQNLVANNNITFASDINDNPARFVLHFVPAAQFTATANTCKGNDGAININLGDYAINGNAIMWDSYTVMDASNNTVAVGNQVNGQLNISNITPGTYTVQLMKDGYTATEHVTVTGATPVTATFTTTANQVQAGSTVHFANTTNGATQYEWTFGDGGTSTLQNPDHTYVAPGSYVVTLIAENSDCSSSYASQMKVGDATGINNIDATSVNIYGNSDKVHFTFSNFATENAVCDIYDVMGRKIINTKTISTKDGNTEIKLDNVVSGYYFVRLTAAEKVFTQKVYLTSEK